MKVANSLLNIAFGWQWRCMPWTASLVKTLRELLAHEQRPCISAFMPTTRGPGNVDKTAWKNVVRETEQRLAEAGHRGTEAQALLQPGKQLLENVPFWLGASSGIAAFSAPGLARAYRLPLPFRDQVTVGNHFLVKPLVPLLSGDGRFFVLAFAKKSVRFFEGTHYTMEEIELTDVPESLAEAMQVEDASRTRTFHTHTAPGGTMQNREAIFHGHGVGVTGPKEGLDDFLHQIDRGIHKHLADQDAPLVLAGVGYLSAMYREITHYRHVLPEGVEGNPQLLSDKELHDRAWAVAEPHFLQARDKLVGLYGQVAGTGRSSNQLDDIVTAAYQGQIQYLLLTQQAECWGTFNDKTMDVQVHERRQPHDDDLVNLAVVYALSHKAMAFAVEPGQLPENAPLAAIFWLPIGERSGKRAVAAGP
jgi:release factor family 3